MWLYSGVRFPFIGAWLYRSSEIELPREYRGVSVEYRECTCDCEVHVADGRVRYACTAWKVEGACVEFIYAVELTNGASMPRPIGIKAIVVNPRFAETVVKNFGYKALEGVLAHEYAEARCIIEGGTNCHYRGLEAECRVMGKDLCLRFRKWAVEQGWGDPEEIEYIQRIDP